MMPLNDSSAARLVLEKIVKSYDGAPLLREVSFEIAPGEIACLLGPSGSGKTTLLRIIAGLESAESGQVVFAGHSLRGVPTHLRGMGLMFQDLALFPHRNVFDNVAFGLEMQNAPRAAIDARVSEMLALVGLGGFTRRDVNQLSGGEQQRVALARAIAPGPRLLMLDEPLGALDKVLREQLVADLRRILKQVGMTSLYVTHDQSEAFAIADRVMFINAGSIVQAGTPREVVEHPANSFVARFLGLDNLLSGNVKQRVGEVLQIVAGDFTFEVSDSRQAPGQSIALLLLPDAAKRVRNEAFSSALPNTIRGSVLESRYQIGRPRITLEITPGTQFQFDCDDAVKVGDAVSVELDPSKILLLDS